MTDKKTADYVDDFIERTKDTHRVSDAAEKELRRLAFAHYNDRENFHSDRNQSRESLYKFRDSLEPK